jgi:hypothetical protein
MKDIHARMIAKLVEQTSLLADENSMLARTLVHIINRVIEEEVDSIFDNDQEVLELVNWLQINRPDSEVLGSFDDIEDLDLWASDMMPMNNRFRKGGSWDVEEN